MTFSVVLEVGLGLMLVYYVLGLVVSGVTSLFARWTEMRAKDLATGLEDMLHEKYDTFIHHPCVHNLQEVRWFPWVQNQNKKQQEKRRLPLGEMRKCQVDRIPAATFARTLFDILAPGTEGKGTVQDIKAGVAALPDGELKNSLMVAIHGGIDTLEAAQQRIEGWYNDAMKGVTALYMHHTRRFVLWLTLGITVLLGVDSIDIGTSLWREPTVRAAVAAQLDQFVQEQPEDDVSAFVSQLEGTRIPIFWSGARLPRDILGWVWKAGGLLITWLAASQGSSFWYDLLKQVRSAPASGGAKG
jgi:hypothetical protein